MAFTYIQSDTGTTNSNAINVAYGSAVTAGSLLVAGVVWGDPTSDCTFGDNNGNDWVPVAAKFQGAVSLSGFVMQLFYAFDANAGAATTTASFTHISDDLFVAIHEYGGTSPTIDGTPVFNNHDSATPTSSPIVTTQAGDLLFLCGFTGFSFSSAGAGFVARETTTIITEDDTDAGAPGSKTGSYNCSLDNNIIGFIAFKETLAPSASLRETQRMRSRGGSW